MSAESDFEVEEELLPKDRDTKHNLLISSKKKRKVKKHN
jgi:hypothetical protein